MKLTDKFKLTDTERDQRLKAKDQRIKDTAQALNSALEQDGRS